MMRDRDCVSTHTSPSTVPEWDLIDRLRKSLRHAGLDSASIAERLGVRPETVSRWLSGRVDPNIRTLRTWAIETDVDYTWLVTGERPHGGAGPGVRSFMPHAALAQSVERFTRNEECNGSPRLVPVAAAA